MHARGVTLGSVVAISGVALVVAVALVSTAFFHLRLSQGQLMKARAQQLAGSAVALASVRVLASLRNGTRLGVSRSTSDTVRVPASDGSAVATFNPAEARDLGVPYSTNNLGVERSAPGSTREVPALAVHLVGLGTCSEATAQIEAVLHVPPFPYAIASSGPIDADESALLVGSLPEGGVLPFDASGALDVAKLLPGHLVSNSGLRGDQQAVVLGAGSRVTGDVLSRGGIHLARDARVLGEVRTPVDAVDIPRIDVTDFDPEGRDDLARLQERSEGDVTLSGHAKYSGKRPMTVDGGLRLDGAVVYVDGDLHVTGGVRGRGALFVTGAVRMDRGAELAADSQVALVAGGDVTLMGQGQDRSSFQGLLYSGGNFVAEQVTLLGSFIANGDSTELNGSMRLRSASVVHVPGSARMKIPIKGPASSPSDDPVADYLEEVQTGEPERYATASYAASSTVEITPRLNESGRRRCYDPDTDTFSLPPDFSAADMEFVVSFSVDPAGQPTVVQAVDLPSRIGAKVIGPLPSQGVYTPQSIVDRMVAQVRVRAEQRVQLANQRYQEAKAQAQAETENEFLDLDLNRFIQPESTVRILLWVER